MNDDPNFTFDGYTVRPIGERDRVYLDLLIEADEYHRGRMNPDFFLNLQPGEDAWAMEDDQGRIVLYFKTSTAVRVAIQFAYWGSHQSHRINQSALAKGLRWLEGVLRQNRFTEILFDSEGRELKAFAKVRMGFTELSMLSKPLKPLRYCESVSQVIPGEGVTADVRSKFAATEHHG